MRYRLGQIKIRPENYGDPDQLMLALRKELSKTLRIPAKKIPEVGNIEIIKESVDARKKPDVRIIYTLDFDCDQKLELQEARRKEYSIEDAVERAGKDYSSLDLKGSRPVIAGFGPCGMFAALVLAQAGLRPVVIERGKAVDERTADVESFWQGGSLDPESNVQFGEGGAGTFSDGKLTTGIKDPRIRKVLQEFVAAGAGSEILYQHKPHLGTDMLKGIVKAIRMEIIRLGGQVLFESRLDGIETEGGSLKAIVLNGGERLETDRLILATGHSARDTFRMLRDKGINMEQKPFSIGFRIEHPQSMIDEAQYGNAEIAEYIGAAAYKLNWKCENGRGVYTFCMCPGGYVIDASTEEGTKVTNGMSNSARDGDFANSALLVDVRTEDFADSDDPLAGVEFQRKYEKLAWENGAVSTYGQFRRDEKDPVRASLPAFASEAILEAMPHLGRKLKGFDSDDSILKGVETRSSSPVRIIRDDRMHSNIKGIIPAGEGPGYAGGIMSAAVDGIRAAEEIIKEKCQSL